MFAYSESEKKYLNVSMLKSLEIKHVKELTIQVVGKYSDGDDVVLKSFKVESQLFKPHLDELKRQQEALSVIKQSQIKKQEEKVEKQIKHLESLIQKEKEKVLSKVVAEAEQYILFVLSGRNIPKGVNGVDAAMAGLAVAETGLAITDIIGILSE